MILVEGTPHTDPVPKEEFVHCTGNNVWKFNCLPDPNTQDTAGEKYLAGCNLGIDLHFDTSLLINYNFVMIMICIFMFQNICVGKCVCSMEFFVFSLTTRLVSYLIEF